MCFVPQRHAIFQHLEIQKWSERVVFCTFWIGNVLRATTACTFPHLNLQQWTENAVFCRLWLRNVLRSTSQLPKVVHSCCVLYILTWKCASRHNGVHFLCISFWLGNVLRATAACNIFASQRPKLRWTRQFLTLFTWKRASRHNGVQLFIFHLASWLRTRRFSERTFRPAGATNHWKKHSVSWLFFLFVHLHLVSSDFLWLSLLWSSFFFSWQHDFSEICNRDVGWNHPMSRGAGRLTHFQWLRTYLHQRKLPFLSLENGWEWCFCLLLLVNFGPKFGTWAT